MTSFGFCSTSDVITFDHNWHHLGSTTAGGKNLSSDTQILMMLEIRMRMLKKLSETQNSPRLHVAEPGNIVKYCPS